MQLESGFWTGIHLINDSSVVQAECRASNSTAPSPRPRLWVFDRVDRSENWQVRTLTSFASEDQDLMPYGSTVPKSDAGKSDHRREYRRRKDAT